MVEIRKYSSHDKSKLVALWARVFSDDPPHNNPSRVIDAKIAHDDLIFVATENEVIIGACMLGYDGHRGWLYAVAVSPDQRRKGVGRQLIHHAIDTLHSMGCIKVNLQIRATNTEVAAFYQSLGFEVEDRLSMGAFVGKAR